MDATDPDDLLRLLRERPEWRAALRREVLTDELLALPETTAVLVGHVGTLAERMDALTQRMDALIAAQERTEQRLAGLVEQVSGMATRLDGVVGYVVERRYHDRAHAYFSTLARRIHVLQPDELEDILEAALAAGQLDERAAQEVRLADVVAHGRRDGQEVFLVVEASRVIDEQDLFRAIGRAHHLERTGRRALAIVAGEVVVPDIAVQASDQGVWVVTNGSVEAPARAA